MPKGRKVLLVHEKTESCGVFHAADKFKHWKDTHLTLDIDEVPERFFSNEIQYDVGFQMKRGRFTSKEMADLDLPHDEIGTVQMSLM